MVKRKKEEKKSIIMGEKTWYKILKIKTQKKKTQKKINSMEDVLKHLLKKSGYK